MEYRSAWGQGDASGGVAGVVDGGTQGGVDDAARLVGLVRAQDADVEAWRAAELHLLERAVRCRLEALGVPVTADLGVALMAIATLLGGHAPEWGGDVRDSLGEVALLGLRLLDP